MGARPRTSDRNGYGPRHTGPKPHEAEPLERAAHELQRADREIARLRDQLDAVSSTLRTINTLTGPYAKRTDLATRPLAPSITVNQSKYNK